MSLPGVPYQFGRILDAHGGGTAPADLTTGYTPGAVVSTRGIGAISGRCSVAMVGGGATKVYLRLMDYTDPTKPRALQWTRMDTGVTANVHEFSASADLAFQANLGGVVPVLAVEKKTDGAAGSTDITLLDLDGFDA